MAKPDPLLYSFFNEIGIINQLTTTQLERVLPDGLKVSHFSVLGHFVRLGDNKTPLELARAFQVTKGAMTNTLSKLEDRRLVKIKPNPDDARSKLVTITAKGRKVREAAVAALGPLFKEYEAVLPLRDMKAALPMLQEVRGTLDKARD